MSIFPLQFVYSIALNMLALPNGLDVVDTIYDYADGQDVQEVVEERNISPVIVDKSGSRRMEQIFGGSVSDGDMMVVTSEPLYIADIYEANQLQRQTFYNYHGYNYRIAAVEPWEDQLGFNAYLAKRHVKQDAV